MLLANACSDSTTSADHPDIDRPEVAANVECYEAEAAPTDEVVGNSAVCAFQDGMEPEVSPYNTLGRLRIECDPSRVAVHVQFSPNAPGHMMDCHPDHRSGTALVCGWTAIFRITAFEFGEGTTQVIIRSDCAPRSGGKPCLSHDNITPHANFGSTEGHCAAGDTFVIDGIAAGQDLGAWADPID